MKPGDLCAVKTDRLLPMPIYNDFKITGYIKQGDMFLVLDVIDEVDCSSWLKVLSASGAMSGDMYDRFGIEVVS